MVPDHAEAEVDIRVPIGISTKTVEEEICRIIQESGAQDVEYSFSWRSEPNSTPTVSYTHLGVPMNAYESFLFETAAAYPAMNAFGCFDASGQWNSRMEDEEGVLEEYQYLVYQNVFDKKSMGEGYR